MTKTTPSFPASHNLICHIDTSIPYFTYQISNKELKITSQCLADSNHETTSTLSSYLSQTQIQKVKQLPIPLCPLHKHQNITSYCILCMVPICPSCLLSEHISHETFNVDSVSTDLNLDKLISNLHSYESNYFYSINQLYQIIINDLKYQYDRNIAINKDWFYIIKSHILTYTQYKETKNLNWYMNIKNILSSTNFTQIPEYLGHNLNGVFRFWSENYVINVTNIKPLKIDTPTFKPFHQIPTVTERYNQHILSLCKLDEISFAVGFDYGHIKIIEYASWSTMKTMKYKSNAMYYLYLHKRSNHWISWVEEPMICIWDCKIGELIRTIQSIGYTIMKHVIEFSNGDIATVDKGKRIIIWDMQNYEIKQWVDSAHEGYVNCVLKMTDSRLVTGGNDKNIKIWNVDDMDKIECVSRILWDDHVCSMWEIEGWRVIASIRNGNVVVYDMVNLVLLCEFEGNKGIANVFVIVSATWVACGRDNGEISIVDVNDYIVKQRIIGDNGDILNGLILWDKRTIISGDGIKCWKYGKVAHKRFVVF